MAQVVLAELDCLLSLAACARDFELVRPTKTKPNSYLPTELLPHSLRRRGPSKLPFRLTKTIGTR